MTQADWDAPKHEVHRHDHAVFVYRDQGDLLAPLETFLNEGIKNREAATFVHSFKNPQEARSFLAKRVAHVDEHEAKKDLSMAAYREAFERNGHIDPKHVEGVVGMLQEGAQASGKDCVRVFVDASRNYFDAGRVDEWFDFEAWLGPRLQAEMGLVCAYRESDLKDPAVLSRVLATHAYRFAAPPRVR